ncbi:MAG: class I SAM-dependent methyltransferase [Ignavibacteriae bacterium]|nr:class I SAM-dependent methyltransferase [Ignavibacteriota bacterium]
MSFSKSLKKYFQSITLVVEDLFLLESFQIKYLPDRVPKKEFATILLANPAIHRYFLAMYPPIGNFISDLFTEYALEESSKKIEENCNDLLWEIADLIIYNKYPDVYDANVEIAWEMNEIIQPKYLEGKVVVDAGAGTGRLAFLIAPFVKTVFAVEPVRHLRQFMKEKAIKENVHNLFVVDGFLDSIPFPENSVDVLMTSNAIGWNLESELKEIERVLKPGGEAIHLLQSLDVDIENHLHNSLISLEWKYEFTKYQKRTGFKIKYSKTMKMDKYIEV